MRPAPQTMLSLGALGACALLAACGGGDKGGSNVQMKDMEVVDGTATDAMTDLDGVQSEGTATVLPASNTASNASPSTILTKPADKRPAEKAPSDDSEVLTDQ